MGESQFTDQGFWSKVKQCAQKLGCQPICIAFKLYYALQRSDIPTWAKTVIYGALAYLISPLDAIPDALPVVGFSDDLVVLGAALGTVAAYIDHDVVQKATNQVKNILGSGCDC